MQNGGKRDAQPGAGNGYVDMFNPDGSLFKRFAAGGTLNAPWGLAETFTQKQLEHVLVGNYGDGRINVFDIQGRYIGQVAAEGKPVALEGLLSIGFTAGGEQEFEHDGAGPLYFTAGAGGNHGLFGYLRQRINVQPGQIPVQVTSQRPVVPAGIMPKMQR